MTGLRAVRLVAGRELREALRRRTFWVVAALLLLGATAAVVVPDVVGDDGGPTRYDVAVVGGDEALDRALVDAGDALGAEIRTQAVDDAAAARRLVADEDADLGVVRGAEPEVIVRAGQQEALLGATRQALSTVAVASALEERGLTAEQAQEALTQPPPRVVEVDSESAARRVASFAVSLVLYLLLLTLMVQVANGIAVEKANRISEVLLAIVRPGALLFGKVLGVGLTGACTLAAAIVPVTVGLAVGGDLPEGLAGALLGGAAWFVLGLALYLTLAGSMGALVERQEEAGSVVTPLTAILVGSFIVAQGGADSALGTVLAYVPLTSPLLVPTRIAIGASSPAELVGSLVLLVAAIALAGRVGSTVYARAVVRTGRRLSLREVLRPG